MKYQLAAAKAVEASRLDDADDSAKEEHHDTREGRCEIRL